MAPSKETQLSPVVLAVHILAVTTGTSQLQQAPFALPPTAFARLIACSHGQVSVDTGEYSEWGHTKPVFLPLGVPTAAVLAETTEVDRGGWNSSTPIELEVSLWDKQQTEGSGVVSRVMLDAVAEVNLPSPKELGNSEKQATEK